MEQEHVDEVMRGVQGSSEKTQVERFHALPVRMGMAGPFPVKRWWLSAWRKNKGSEGVTVAKVIEFYIPAKFEKRVQWVPLQQRGKVIEFSLPTKKSA